MPSNLIKFDFRGYEVRTFTNEDNLFFVAKDVCDCLGLDNNREALKELDDDEKGVRKTDTLGGKQELNYVNESGLYNLIFRSTKPQAKVFRKWVTNIVLPSIRKTGFYGLDIKQLRENLTDDEKKLIIAMHTNFYLPNAIAKELGCSSKMVNDHLSELRVAKKKELKQLETSKSK